MPLLGARTRPLDVTLRIGNQLHAPFGGVFVQFFEIDVEWQAISVWFALDGIGCKAVIECTVIQ